MAQGRPRPVCGGAIRQKVSERSRPGYERSLREIEDMQTTTGTTVAHIQLSSITTRAVDKIYANLQTGPRKKNRTRQANHKIDIARRAWSVVRRLYPHVVPEITLGSASSGSEKRLRNGRRPEPRLMH